MGASSGGLRCGRCATSGGHLRRDGRRYRGGAGRLWLAQALINQNRRAEADVELQRALAFYGSEAATRYVREAEGLLAASA